jgi:hypothetical protein
VGHPHQKKWLVRYERRWYTGNGNPDGAYQFYGSTMKEGDSPKVELDGTLVEVWYFCNTCNDWAQIPHGFIAVEEADPF